MRATATTNSRRRVGNFVVQLGILSTEQDNFFL